MCCGCPTTRARVRLLGGFIFGSQLGLTQPFSAPSDSGSGGCATALTPPPPNNLEGCQKTIFSTFPPAGSFGTTRSAAEGFYVKKGGSRLLEPPSLPRPRQVIQHCQGKGLAMPFGGVDPPNPTPPAGFPEQSPPPPQGVPPFYKSNWKKKKEKKKPGHHDQGHADARCQGHARGGNNRCLHRAAGGGVRLDTPGATRSAPTGMAVLPASLKRHHGAENLTGSRRAAQAWRWRPARISRLDHRRQWRRRRTAVACIIPQHSGLATTRHVCDGRCHDTTPAAPKGGYKRHPWSINEK